MQRSNHILSLFVLFTFFLTCRLVKGQVDTSNVYLFGGEFYEDSGELIELTNGGYAFIGTSGSDQQNNTEFYLVKTDENFECLWNQVLGSFGADKGSSICQAENGDIVMCGYGVAANSTDYDMKVFRISENGELIWQKEYGGEDWDFSNRVVPHPGGGFVICGTTYSYGNGDSDGYLLHVDENGELITEWTYGDLGEDGFTDVDMTDDCIIVSGYTENLINGRRNAQMIKLDLDGVIIWKKTDVLTDHDGEYSNTKISGNYIFSCGNYFNSNEHHLGFMMCRYLDSSAIFWMNAENHNGDYVFSDFALNEENIFLMGYTNAYGDGSDNGTITVNNFYGSWQNAITIGTDYLNLTSGILSNGKLVMAIKTLNTEIAPTYQGGLFVYPDLTPAAGSETIWHNAGCFSLNLFEVNSGDRFEYIRYFDMIGRALTPLLSRGETMDYRLVNQGLVIEAKYDREKKLIGTKKLFIE